MKKLDVLKQFHAAVGELGNGFVLFPSKSCYQRQRLGVTDFYHLNLLPNHGCWNLSIEAFVGHKEVNQIFEKVLKRKVSPPYTYGFGLDNVESTHNTQRKPSPEINDFADIPPAAAKAQEYFSAVALPFYESVASLAGLDATVNQADAQGRFRPKGYQWAFMGLIVACLVRNPAARAIFDGYVESFGKSSTADLSAIWEHFKT